MPNREIRIPVMNRITCVQSEDGVVTLHEQQFYTKIEVLNRFHVFDQMPQHWKELVWEHGDEVITLYLRHIPYGIAIKFFQLPQVFVDVMDQDDE